MSITAPVTKLVIGALSGPPIEGDPVDHAILESTLHCIALFGIERMTVADVAHSAGVGRATVFRRFETKDELIRRAFAFELARIVRGFGAKIAQLDDPREQLVELTVEAVRIARTHPVGARLVEDGTAFAVHHNREIATPQLAFLGARIDDCAARLGLEVDPAAIAEVLLRFIGSVWLTPDIGLAVDDDANVRRMVQVILSPLTQPTETKLNT